MARDVVERLRPEVEILSDPPGATVSTLDDKELGTTPLKSRLVVGEYTLVFSLRRYDPVEARLVVREGRKATISQTLVAQKNAPQLTRSSSSRSPAPATASGRGSLSAARPPPGPPRACSTASPPARSTTATPRTSAAWDDQSGPAPRPSAWASGRRPA
ncbi:MAG: PEGA domain-containing protein [bacterium]